MKERKCVMFKKKWQRLTTFFIWIFFLLWAIFTMPNVSELVKEKGQVTIPGNLESQIANRYAREFGKGENSNQIIAVFNSDHKLTVSDKDSIKKKLAELSEKKADYQIEKIIQSSDSKEVAKQVNSKDQTTQLDLISVKKSAKIDKVAIKLRERLKIKGLHVYTTGAQVLAKEFAETTQKGVKKTELISVIFIFIVLIMVFRSPIVPIISLTTVGISYIISTNLVMNLAEFANFPISNFTQVFMVVVLFGIGTDYNILLYDRFKEELAKGLDKSQATISAHKKAGRTIIYSGSTVLIGFTVLCLAQFDFYRSAVGVAVGVGVLLLNLLTFNSVFMHSLGVKIFWPNHEINKHESRSKLGDKLAQFSLTKPLVNITLIGILAVGIILIGQSKLSYDNSVEIPETNPARLGYKVIQDHYSKGMTATTTLYVKNDKKLTTKENLALIDDLTNYIQKEDGVKTVNSVTQPTGTKIKQLYLGSQLKNLIAGISSAQEGINQVNSGLGDANDKLKEANVSQQVQRVQTLADSTNQVANASQQLNEGTVQYTSAVDKVNSNLNQINTATRRIKRKAESIKCC